MVIISSGALSTPQILERSGIGDAARLKSLSIDIVSDLPGVGQDYQDHHLVGKAIFHVDVSADDTGDDIVSNNPDTHARHAEEFMHGRGGFVWNYVDTGMKYRPTPDEVKSMGPEFENVWKEHFVNKPDKPLLYIGVVSTYIIRNLVLD
jgi:alcohol oxidase